MDHESAIKYHYHYYFVPVNPKVYHNKPNHKHRPASLTVIRYNSRIGILITYSPPKLSVIHLISNAEKTSVVSSGVYTSLSFEMIDCKCLYSLDEKLDLDLTRTSVFISIVDHGQ